jgi:hypothetical protein
MVSDPRLQKEFHNLKQIKDDDDDGGDDDDDNDDNGDKSGMIE